MKFPICLILSLLISVDSTAQLSVELNDDDILFHDKNYPILNLETNDILLQNSGYTIENDIITSLRVNEYVLYNNLSSLKTKSLSTGFNSSFSETSIRQFNNAPLYYHLSWNLVWQKEIYKGWNLNAGIAPSYCYYLKAGKEINNIQTNFMMEHCSFDTPVLLGINHKFKNGTEISFGCEMGLFQKYGLLSVKFKF